MGTAQIIHLWFAVVCFSCAVLGMTSMIIGFILPVRHKTGGRLFSAGMTMAISAVIVYLLYAVAAVVGVVVSRS